MGINSYVHGAVRCVIIHCNDLHLYAVIPVTFDFSNLQYTGKSTLLQIGGHYILSNKDARIQHKQIIQYIQLLEDHGTRLGEKITKHLDEDIWELRPGDNRVLFFYHKDDTFVLLHQFRKKTQKTPPREIAKAKHERDDWISRKGK